MGKSRSATVLAAYLMRSRKIVAKDAVALIKEQRSFVEPNPGFMEQLELYHKVNFTTDLDNHPMYQRWLYKKELEMSKAAGVAPERVHFRDAERAVADITQLREGETSDESGMIELRCKTCRYDTLHPMPLSTSCITPAPKTWVAGTICYIICCPSLHVANFLVQRTDVHSQTRIS